MLLILARTLAVATLLMGCSSKGSSASAGGGSGGDPCAAASAHLAECAASVPITTCDATDPGWACQAPCLLDASCSDLQRVAQNPTPDPSLQVGLCQLACATPTAVTACANGVLIYASQVCDGTTQCTDGSDEVGCSPPTSWFPCADGSDTIPGAWRCNGTADCVDGSDETGCPAP